MSGRARTEYSCRETDDATDGSVRGHGPVNRSVALAVVLCSSIGVGVAGAGEKDSPALVKGPRPVGSLVIVGGGMLPAAIQDRFIELAGGRNARLVVIPTASQRAEAGKLESLSSYAYWGQLAKAGKVKSLVFLHTRQPAQANDPAFVKPLTEATAVWFTGGDQSLLTAAYKGTAVEKEVKNLLARGGVIGGTSAGAAVMSEVMIRFGNPVAQVGTGFGFLPGVVVDQHFVQRNRQARLLGVLSKHPDCLGMGIDEQTGIVVRGQSVTVVGNSNVRLCVPAHAGVKSEVRVCPAGTHLDLGELHRLLNPILKTSALQLKPPSTDGEKGK
jgi:cyanophycinase